MTSKLTEQDIYALVKESEYTERHSLDLLDLNSFDLNNPEDYIFTEAEYLEFTRIHKHLNTTEYTWNGFKHFGEFIVLKCGYVWMPFDGGECWHCSSAAIKEYGVPSEQSRWNNTTPKHIEHIKEFFDKETTRLLAEIRRDNK